MCVDGLLSISIQTNQTPNHLLTRSHCSANKLKEKKEGGMSFPLLERTAVRIPAKQQHVWQRNQD